MDRSRLALLLAAAALLLSLFVPWREPGPDYVLFGALDRFDPSETGWERWAVLDVALAALAAGLVVLALRPGRALGIVLGAAALLAVACIVVSGFDTAKGWDAGEGPVLALVALALGVGGAGVATRRTL